jgi:hypothetical protein
MQGYSKGSLVTSKRFQYIGKVVVSMQGYSKESLEPSITVHYNG